VAAFATIAQPRGFTFVQNRRFALGKLGSEVAK